jgi:hypothetical protein
MVEQDRRKHPRVPVHIDIAYDNDVVLTQANLTDLSLGGANVFTDVPLPVGTQLSLWFRAADPGFELKGRVLRVTEEDPDDETARPGMGVQFFGISPEEEETMQELINWYLLQPTPIVVAAEELPKVEEVSEQRYIETQILPTIEASLPEKTVQIRLPAEVLHASPHEELETTQVDTGATAEFEAPQIFRAPTPSDDSIQTIRLSPEDMAAQRAARENPPAFETVRIHPEDLNALQTAAQDASSTISHEHSDTTTTLPEMPAFNPDLDALTENPADSGERKSRRKKKKKTEE